MPKLSETFCVRGNPNIETYYSCPQVTAWSGIFCKDQCCFALARTTQPADRGKSQIWSNGTKLVGIFFYKRWELETLVVFLSHHFSEVLNNLIICTSAYRRVLSKSIIKILSNSPKEIQDPPEKNREKYQVVAKNTGPQLLECLCAYGTQSLLHSVFRDVWCMHWFFDQSIHQPVEG